MKKFYSLLLAAMAFAMPAQAYEVIVNFDNAEAVTVYKGDRNWYYSIDDFKQFPEVEITQGENVLDIDGYLWFVANDGYFITSKFETGQSYVETLPYGGSWSYVSQSYQPIPTRSYNITTQSKEEFYDSSLTLNCDDFSQIEEASFNDDYNLRFDLPTDGSETMEVPFSSKYHSTLCLSKNGGAFYKVLVNDVDVANPGSRYAVDLTDMNGKTVQVLCNYPEVECKVSVTFANEGTEACVSSVSIEGEPVENVDLSNITLMCGEALSINYDTDMYEIKSVKVNGEDGDTWSFYRQIMGDTEIVIEAEKYPTLTKKIYVEGAEFIKLGKGRYNSDNLFELVEGDNTYEYSLNNNTIYLFDLDANYYMAELSDNGNEISFNKWGTNIDLDPEGELRIILGKINRDKQVIIYLDSELASDNHQGRCYWRNSNSDYRYVTEDIKPGYNVVDFFDGDGELCMNWTNAYGTKDNLFLNEEKHDPEYYYGYSYKFTPAHNDVVKVFLDSDPEPVQLTFETEGDVDAEGVKDMVTPVDLNSSYSVLPGTLVKVSSPSGKNINVAVGDEAGKDAEVHEFTVNADTKVTVKPGTDTGVENVAADAVAADAAVYNLQGVKVGTKADMQRLPKGVYVVGGVKVVK